MAKAKTTVASPFPVSTEKNNKVIIHICGGGAYNAVRSIRSKMFVGERGLPDVDLRYIDTTDINILSHAEALDAKFFKIDSVLSGSENEVSGSGGDRSTHLDSKVNGIQEYIKENKWIKNESGVFHFVIFTLGGGSGSTLGQILLKELKKKDITCIAFAIGDSHTYMTASNTYSTLGGLDKMVRELGTNLTMFYYNNASMLDESITEAEQTVNRLLLSDLNLTSVFLSLCKTNIDNADMHMFLDQSKYSGNYKAEPGLMELVYVRDEYKQDKDTFITMVRTLLKEGCESKLNLQVIQRKIGVIMGDELNKKLSGYDSINLITMVNSFQRHINDILETLSTRKKVTNAEIQMIEGEDILDI